MFVLDATLV
uniref:Uncharacterized protein n=1 Tax=Zea mays TaxID=4577 RepID=C4J730_MAIZE|nr:unknown [Zea mays]